uniref:Uncharacterized protein n=1 Tax=Globisporangium ultimum (strain ATCC 200006 / CBS 805.95 / DAOM BR144) TaxID=431595 RepID=K3WSN9_GLOUD
MIRCPSPDFRFPTHSVGVVEDDDAYFKRTKVIHAQESIDLEHAFDSEKALRRKEIAYNRSKLELWKNNLHFEPLSSKMDHPFVKVNAKRATQVTILHTPEYSPNSKFHAQVEKLTEKRFPLRWRNMTILLDAMRRTPCRRPVLQDIEKLFALAYEVSYKNANSFELSRQQYWDILQKEYPSVEIRHANRLFSSYDYKMVDRMDIRVFLGTIRALRVQQGTPLEILCLSLQDFDTTKRGIVTSLDNFQAALMCYCGHEDEEKQMRAQATALWKQMGMEFQVYQLQHHRYGGEHRDNASPTHTEREAYESCEDGHFSFKYVRLQLQKEARVLSFYSEMLLKRREECFKAPIPPSR